jgi:hypothetical protein
VEKVANPVGRPSKLTDELKAKAKEYLFSYESQGDVIPSAAGLACWLGISKASVYNFGEQDGEFLDTLSAIQAKQEVLTLNKGITGEFNSTIAKLVLANHGYSDKVQQDHTSSDGSMTPKDQGAAVLEALRAKHDTNRNS